MPSMPPVQPSLDVRAIAGLLTHPSAARAAALDDRLLLLADAHGVMPLLADRLAREDLLAAVAPAIRDSLTRTRRDAAVLDMIGREHARQVFAAFGAAGIDAIVFKGAALAETHYAPSWLRPRGDVDLLVPGSQAAAAGAVLKQQGCRRLPRPDGELATYQARYVAASAGVDATYDLHWRVADPQAFAGVLDHAALAGGAVQGPWSGTRMAGPVDAFLIACVHRAAHHFDTDRLLLLYDIDRLARRFSAEEWDRVASSAEAARLRAVCRRGLDLAAALFETPFPPAIGDRLAASAADEPTARYVAGAVTRKVDVLRSDLEQLPSWAERLALVREHLFPPPAYMAARYGAGCHWPLLPLLYLDRIIRGATGWFRPVR